MADDDVRQMVTRKQVLSIMMKAFDATEINNLLIIPGDSISSELN